MKLAILKPQQKRSNWSRFIIKRNSLLIMRDKPGLALFTLVVGAVVPVLSVQGARKIADMLQAGLDPSATGRLYMYLALFLLVQNVFSTMGMLFIAKMWRRPSTLRYLPYDYRSCITQTVRLSIVLAILVSCILYGPLYFYAARVAHNAFGLHVLFNLVLYTGITCAIGAVCFLVGLRVIYNLKVSNKYWRSSAIVSLMCGGLVLPILVMTKHAWWVKAMWRPNMQHSLILGIMAFLIGALLYALVRHQPEFPLAMTGKKPGKPKRQRQATRVRTTNITSILNFRQQDVNVLFVLTAIGIALSGLAIRHLEAAAGSVLQSAVSAILPYSAALYSLGGRSNLYGKEVDGTLYLPLKVKQFTSLAMSYVAAWQLLLTTIVLLLLIITSGGDVSWAGYLEFMQVTVCTAALAYTLGTLFYKNTLSQRAAAVGFFFALSITLQTFLQAASQRHYNLNLITGGLYGVSMVIIWWLETGRRSNYARS